MKKSTFVIGIALVLALVCVNIVGKFFEPSDAEIAEAFAEMYYHGDYEVEVLGCYHDYRFGERMDLLINYDDGTCKEVSINKEHFKKLVE